MRFQHSNLPISFLACFCVLLISLDRLLAFTLKTRYKSTVTCKRIRIAMTLVWLYVAGLCSIPFAYETEKCGYNPPPNWVVFMLSVNCFVPCVIIAVIYMFIGLRLRQFDLARNKLKFTEPPATSNTQNQANVTTEQPLKSNTTAACKTAHKSATKATTAMSKSNRRILRNTMILVATYGIAWFPSIIYFTIQSLFPEAFDPAYHDSAADQYIGFFLKYIKFVEGITSPILYCYLNTYFRKTVMDIFCIDTSAIIPERTEAPPARLATPDKHYSTETSST